MFSRTNVIPISLLLQDNLISEVCSRYGENSDTCVDLRNVSTTNVDEEYALR